MQKVSLIINAVLLLLIGVLFYLVFSKNNTTTAAKSPEGAKIDKSVKIAYIDIDTLQENYKYFTEKRKELETKASSMQTTLQNKQNELQRIYEDAVRNAATMTQNQLEAKQMELEKRKNELENSNATFSQQMETEQASFNEAFLKKIEDYIAKINKDKEYSFVFTYSRSLGTMLYKDSTYDITKSVVYGLNKEYEESIKK